MVRGSVLVKVVAAALVASLQWLAVPAAPSATLGAISGRVLSTDTSAPMKGVQVHVGNPRTGEIRSSAPTGEDGSFTVAGLPPATYELAVQAPRALYVVSGAVPVTDGAHRAVQVAVNPETAPSPAAKERASRGGAKWWNNPFTATLIVIGAAVVIGVVVDNATNDESSSEFVPE